MFNLSGKTAIVTGGSGLYGKQITLALAQAGAHVYIASRNVENNKDYAKVLLNQGYSVQAEFLDQSDEESITTLERRISSCGRSVDILVNNSVLRTMSSFEDDAAQFEASMKVNATGIFLMTRIFGGHMASQGKGSIINIGSYMGTLGPDDTLYRDVGFSGFNSPDYFFHKGGMTNFTKFAAAYYGPKGVRCNIVQLGGFYNGQDSKFVERYSERTFLKRMAGDTDIMGIVVFLASDASAYITGASIPVDGGYSAK